MNKEIRAKQLQSDEDDVMFKPRDLYYDDDRSTSYTAIAQTMPPTAPPLATALPINLNTGDNKSSDVLESITMGFQNIIHDAEPQFQRMMQNNFSASGEYFMMTMLIDRIIL
jgi:hypothetical protein